MSSPTPFPTEKKLSPITDNTGLVKKTLLISIAEIMSLMHSSKPVKQNFLNAPGMRKSNQAKLFILEIWYRGSHNPLTI